MATRDKRRRTVVPEDTRPGESDEEEVSQGKQQAEVEDIKVGTADEQEEGGEEKEETLPPPPPGLPADYPREGRAGIRKGIYLSALIYVEGERPPRADFTREAKAALKDALQDALANVDDDLSMTLKGITVQNNIEGDETGGETGEEAGEEAGEGADRTTRGEEKFDF
jgi:hypothetical protein